MNKSDIAWNNAIQIENLNPKHFRICYICKKMMNHGNKWDTEKRQTNGWNVDHIDGNKNNQNDLNLAAVHYTCNVQKANRDYSDVFRKIKASKWK